MEGLLDSFAVEAREAGDSFCGIETVEVGKTSPDRHGSC